MHARGMGAKGYFEVGGAACLAPLYPKFVVLLG